MRSSSYSSLEDLANLSSEDKETLDKILEILHGQDDIEKAEMIETLGDYPFKDLYAFSENSPEVHSLLEKNEYLNTCWAKRLKKINQPSCRISPFDKNEEMEVSIFSQLKGVVLMKQLDTYIENEKEKGKEPDLSHPDIFPILNKACDLGIFKALVLRLGHYTKLINKSGRNKEDSDAITTYIEYQFHDVHKLSNLYWALGCIDSSLVLFNNAKYYFKSFKDNIDSFFSTAMTSQFSWLTKYDDKHRPYPIAILELAVENIYIARLLSEFPESKQITDEIMHDKGLLAGFEKIFSNVDELQKYVMKKLEDLDIKLVESFCRNAYKHSIQTIHEHHPDYELPEELPQDWLRVKI